MANKGTRRPTHKFYYLSCQVPLCFWAFGRLPSRQNIWSFSEQNNLIFHCAVYQIPGDFGEFILNKSEFATVICSDIVEVMFAEFSIF